MYFLRERCYNFYNSCEGRCLWNSERTAKVQEILKLLGYRFCRVCFKKYTDAIHSSRGTFFCIVSSPELYCIWRTAHRRNMKRRWNYFFTCIGGELLIFIWLEIWFNWHVLKMFEKLCVRLKNALFCHWFWRFLREFVKRVIPFLASNSFYAKVFDHR